MWHSNFTVAAQYVMSPPIRSAEHAPALKKALAGGILQLVATDHAVFTSKQKEMGRGDFRKIPNGVNGIEGRDGALDCLRFSTKKTPSFTDQASASTPACIPLTVHRFSLCMLVIAMHRCILLPVQGTAGNVRTCEGHIIILAQCSS
jgi:dihydroorotase-like cyclic amidohydrolase